MKNSSKVMIAIIVIFVLGVIVGLSLFLNKKPTFDEHNFEGEVPQTEEDKFEYYREVLLHTDGFPFTITEENIVDRERVGEDYYLYINVDGKYYRVHCTESEMEYTDWDYEGMFQTEPIEESGPEEFRSQ